MIEGMPERLRKLRLKNNLSQKTVAERIHISQSMVAGYETGYRTPSTEVLLSLAYLYQCSTDYLLGKEKTSNFILLDAQELTNDQIEAIMHLIDTIKRK